MLSLIRLRTILMLHLPRLKGPYAPGIPVRVHLIRRAKAEVWRFCKTFMEFANLRSSV
jgi:hypothetical protein